MTQYISESELEEVTNLLAFLNENGSSTGVVFDVRIVDSNGDFLGALKTIDAGETYALHLGAL